MPSLPILIVSAFPERLPPLLAELGDRPHEIIEAPVGAQATLRPNPYWRDARNPKLMSWGEVACYEGHWRAWRRVVELDEPCIVLEDDAKLLQPLPHDAPAASGRFLWYLGYKPLRPVWAPPAWANASPWPGWKPAPFCWWTLGYTLTPEMAQALIALTNAWGGRVIPVDEAIPALYTGEVSENRLGLIDLHERESCQAFVPAHDKRFVEPRGFDSQTDTYEGAFMLQTVVFATDAARVSHYVDELNALGHTVTVLGAGEPDWDTSAEGGRQKLEWLAQAGFADDDIVLCLDGYDTRVLTNPEETLKAYGAMRYAVIVSGEKTYWPDRGLKDVFGGDSPYPCSGLLIGPYADLKGLAADYPDEPDDQAIMQRAVIDNDARWWIDTNSTIFRSLSHDEEADIAAGTVAYHWNGPARPAPARWLNPHDNYILEVAPDVMQITLMSEQEAAWLYEALMREDGWEPLPGDSVPGDELRLGFRGAIEDRMRHVVYDQWQPAKWQPIKDLFAIRYSQDRQPSLQLHNDKSYLSMSILLHREGAGGEVCFPRQNYTDRLARPGQALLWPSAITHPHLVTPTEGSRMSLVVWTSPPSGT